MPTWGDVAHDTAESCGRTQLKSQKPSNTEYYRTFFVLQAHAIRRLQSRRLYVSVIDQACNHTTCTLRRCRSTCPCNRHCKASVAHLCERSCVAHPPETTYLGASWVGANLFPHLHMCHEAYDPPLPSMQLSTVIAPLVQMCESLTVQRKYITVRIDKKENTHADPCTQVH